jgi:hypothetical protein
LFGGALASGAVAGSCGRPGSASTPSPVASPALGIAGYAVGRNRQRIADAFHGPAYVVAGITGLAVVVAIVIHLRRRRRADTATTARPEPVRTSDRP